MTAYVLASRRPHIPTTYGDFAILGLYFVFALGASGLFLAAGFSADIARALAIAG